MAVTVQILIFVMFVTGVSGLKPHRQRYEIMSPNLTLVEGNIAAIACIVFALIFLGIDLFVLVR